MDAQKLKELRREVELAQKHGTTPDISAWDLFEVLNIAERAVSPAESVQSIDTPEFEQLLRAYALAYDGESALDEESMDTLREAKTYIIAHIDAKLAQARHEAWCEGVNIDALREHNAELESRLAEIQRGVEGLTRWRITGDYIGDPVEFITHPEGELVYLKYVLALLQPQDQADTSGLPG